MRERTNELIEIVQYMHKQQYILTKMLIHLGCRSDLCDSFICDCLNELNNLKVPKSEPPKISSYDEGDL